MYRYLVALAAFLAIQGCVTNRQSASVSPDAQMARLRTFYVVKFAPDEHGIERLIAAELTRLASPPVQDLRPRRTKRLMSS
jgi:hypothetical protein